MITAVRKKTVRVFILALCSLAMVSHCHAGLSVTTELATGMVVRIHENVITLDSGMQFHPAGQHMKLEVAVGDQVTIRFFTDAEGKNKYTAVAPGKNSLTKSPAPAPGPKRMR